MEAAPDSLRRARPLLGTFVEIAVAGAAIPAMEAAVEAAFAAIAKVHRLMSFHEPDSDVSRLNRGAAASEVRVHDWTYRVLETACDLHHRSAGIFDVAVAPALQELGVLPRPPDDVGSAPAEPGETPKRQLAASSWPGLSRPSTPPMPCIKKDVDGRDKPGHDDVGTSRPIIPGASDTIQLLPGNQVRFARHGVTIDLGGIAKGFAVDRAIAALRRHGMPEGLVNAGGDVAAFGSRGHAVDIRNPRQAGRPMCQVALRNAALASSAGRFDPVRSCDVRDAAVIDPATAMPVRAVRGATVCARDCIIADALTKVVMNAGEAATPVLRHYGASALFMSAQGEVHVTADWKHEVRFAA